MRLMLRIVVGFLLLSETACLSAAPIETSFLGQLADYDAELRKQDGRVDANAMARRLNELGVTTYYWLIWHSPNDWEDLRSFLPKAAEVKIQVWVYLVPPSEGPPQYPASEPFKLDYLRWAEEIARLSIDHTNLTGWVIDDFYANHQFFNPSYVGKMQARAKALNPHLVFLPLMYFPEITAYFVDEYASVIDGVVVAYPRDREEIDIARGILNGLIYAIPGSLSFPWNTPSQAGDYAAASVTANRQNNAPVRIRFSQRDDFSGPTAGYHFKQMLVNGRVLWEQDAAGGAGDWEPVQVDATAAVADKTKLTLTFRLFDKKGVSNFGVHWRIKDLRVDGVELAADLARAENWITDSRGPFELGFGQAMKPKATKSPVHVPFVVMTAASSDEFRLRHGEPASPQRIAQWVKMCLEARKAGQVDGVVTYCLDKSEQSQVFPLVKEILKGK